MACIRIKTWLNRFRRQERGSVTVEAIITLPLLIWGVGMTYEFFEVHRYKSTRDKAAYTIADMVSREMLPINATYINNAKTVFDTITNDNGNDALRVTIIKYDEDEDEYSVKWSEVRGPTKLSKLTTADVKDAHATLPAMRDGEELVVVESLSDYPARFDVGFTDGMQVATRVTTIPRFAPQINWSNS
ncbi:TadE/TadG family type IV pilus assembly protein [Roseovarius aquimarinus]|uniref:TadE/TadG family type IV pilus assembly protein n=1 Tax=Roseovarius aquimarinus TaxID=1229156 RepID=A0ABW7I7R0_9RHOB